MFPVPVWSTRSEICMSGTSISRNSYGNVNMRSFLLSEIACVFCWMLQLLFRLTWTVMLRLICLGVADVILNENYS